MKTEQQNAQESCDQAQRMSVKWVAPNEGDAFRLKHGHLVEHLPGEDPEKYGPQWATGMQMSFSALCVNLKVREGISIAGHQSEKIVDIQANRELKAHTWYHEGEVVDLNDPIQLKSIGDESVFRGTTERNTGSLSCKCVLGDFEPKICFLGDEKPIKKISLDVRVSDQPIDVEAAAWRQYETPVYTFAAFEASSEQLNFSVEVSNDKFQWICDRLKKRNKYLMVDVDLERVPGFYGDCSLLPSDRTIKVFETRDKIENYNDVPDEFWHQFDRGPVLSLRFSDEEDAESYLDYDTEELRLRALVHPSDAIDSYQLPDLDEASNADPKHGELMNRLDRIEGSNYQLIQNIRNVSGLLGLIAVIMLVLVALAVWLALGG
ncbi:hypothetical protein [Ruegeria arenilitoris]|nr:hypothetical protein [Ruegeria arenilitoris]